MATARLTPVGKAYFGFTDEELKRLDKFVRDNTVERFGPVRSVRADKDFGLVLEIAFEGLQRSTRHKSGVAMRFPARQPHPLGQAGARSRRTADAGKAAGEGILGRLGAGCAGAPQDGDEQALGARQDGQRQQDEDADHSTAEAQAGRVVRATIISISGTKIWPTMMMVSQGAASSARIAPNFSPQALHASTGLR